MSITPKERPKLSRAEAEKILRDAGISLEKNPVIVLGYRGYYSKTFGKPGNDIGVDDDAFFIVSPGVFRAFNGNVDPSIRKPRIATLISGLFRFVNWRHRGQYKAFQIVQDRVTRQGLKGIDVGRHGINFHYHGLSKTDSLGCQTMPKVQFLEFQPLLEKLLNQYNLKEGVYYLHDPEEAKK